MKLTNSKMKIDFKNINKTKIVCTIGPSCANYKTLKQMALAGMNVARVNMSHGDYSFYAKIANMIRQINNESNGDLNVAIMTDTKGPEIRVGKLSRPLNIKQGSLVTIKTKSFNTPTRSNTFYVYDSTKKYNMAKDLKAGNLVLVDDGKLHLKVLKVNVNKGLIETKALNSHVVLTNKRINLPNSHYSLPFLSKQDKISLINSIKLKADYIALSFVNSAKDIKDVRRILGTAGRKIQLIAKIETQQALNNIKVIIKEADGIMIARGDLALETPFYNIPCHEVEIIKLCKQANKPVIVATQMLDSLESNLQPTRAEVTDVYFACINGADATMLSGETASGKYPVESVKTMNIINKASEKCFDNKSHFKNVFLKNKLPMAIRKQIADIYLQLTRNKRFAFIINTNDETLIKAISLARFNALAIVVTSNPKLLTKFSCNYGIKMYYDAKPSKNKKVMYL